MLEKTFGCTIRAGVCLLDQTQPSLKGRLPRVSKEVTSSPPWKSKRGEIGEVRVMRCAVFHFDGGYDFSLLARWSLRGRWSTYVTSCSGLTGCISWGCGWRRTGTSWSPPPSPSSSSWYVYDVQMWCTGMMLSCTFKMYRCVGQVWCAGMMHMDDVRIHVWCTGMMCRCVV